MISWWWLRKKGKIVPIIITPRRRIEIQQLGLRTGKVVRVRRKRKITVKEG
jgi:hypothetical protein